MAEPIEFLMRGTVCARWNPTTREVTTADGEIITTGVGDDVTAYREVRDFYDDCAPITQRDAPPTAREKLMELSRHAADDATECSRRGDTNGSFYARGCRDAYANAALIAGGA